MHLLDIYPVHSFLWLAVDIPMLLSNSFLSPIGSHAWVGFPLSHGRTKAFGAHGQESGDYGIDEIGHHVQGGLVFPFWGEHIKRLLRLSFSLYLRCVYAGSNWVWYKGDAAMM